MTEWGASDPLGHVAGAPWPKDILDLVTAFGPLEYWVKREMETTFVTVWPNICGACLQRRSEWVHRRHGAPRCLDCDARMICAAVERIVTE